MEHDGHGENTNELYYVQRVGKDGEWRVRMTWTSPNISGGPTRLTVEPTDPDNPPPIGISQTVLRDIQIAEAVKRTMNARENQANSKPLRRLDWDETGKLLRRLSADGISDEYLAALSWAYAMTSDRSKLQERLAELVEKSPAAIKNHLWQATRKGLLIRLPGRSVGGVTQKAIDIIAGLPSET